MTPAAFLAFSQVFTDPLVLLNAEGRVMAASANGQRAGLWDAQPVERMFHELVEESQADVERYLRNCRGTAHPVPGAFTFGSGESGPMRCRANGVCRGHGDEEHGIQVMLRLTLRGKGATDSFSALNSQVDKLNDELRAKHGAMAALATKEERLRNLLQTTQDAVVFIDGAHSIVSLNPAAESIFGYPSAELLGQPVTKLMPEPHRAKHDEYIDRYERTGEARAIGRVREVMALRKNGAEFPIELSVAPALHGEDVQYAAFIRDISERTRFQAELLDSGRLAAIGTTAAKFAHEVANPLNGMFMHVQLLNRRFASSELAVDPRAVRSVGLIGDEIERLIRLLQEFRNLSSKQVFRLRPTSLRDLLGRCIEAHAVEPSEKNITVAAELGDDPSMVKGDSDKLSQALLNLCKNAVEAMVDGGMLTIHLGGDAETVHVEISDTGCGVPEGLDIFSPFTTTKEQGTGLGLPVVRQIIASHGGAIRCESEVGRGTTFHVSLPRVDPAAEPSRRAED